MPMIRMIAIVMLLVACKKEREPDKLPVPEPPGIDAARVDQEAAEADRAMEAMTQGAVDGSILMKFAPATLAGVTRSQRLEQVFAVAAAYELDNGGYANLDIKNSFRRGGVDL